MSKLCPSTTRLYASLHHAWMTRAAVCALALITWRPVPLARAQDDLRGSPEPSAPPSGPDVPRVAPAPDDYAPAAPPPSRLGPTEADYATAAGNVPPGTTPREFVFDRPRDVARFEGSFMIGVPIWFTPDRGVVDPGVSFEGRFARRFGLIAPELTFGWQLNWLDEDELPSAYRSSDETVDSFFLSVGARLYMLRDAVVTPFISAAFDLSFWHFTGDNTTVCDYYYCTRVADYDPGIGFSGRVGLAILPTERFQLELGAKIAMAFPVGPFDRTQGWVTPYIGFMGRF